MDGIKRWGTRALLLGMMLACGAGHAAESNKAVEEGFDRPTGVATDGAGNIYVADTDNSLIRKVRQAGAVTTFAGTRGGRRHAKEAGTGVRFDRPEGIATDGAGNLYVADTGNHAIRKITSAGEVTLFAKPVWFAGETGLTPEHFGRPVGIAVDKAGNVYVTDVDRDAIRKITPEGRVATLANVPSPYGIAVDGAGNVYVAGPYLIRRISPDGAMVTLAGSGHEGSADGTGTQASFDHPGGLAIDRAGNLYVADTLNYTLRKITPDGKVTTLAGSAGVPDSVDGQGNLARFNNPVGIAIGREGELYVADVGNNQVRRVTPAGMVTTLAGVPPEPEAAEPCGGDDPEPAPDNH